jgi:hypothetical protein
VVTSTLGRVVVTTSLSRTQWTQTRSVAKLGLLPKTCVLVFDVVYGFINIIVRTRVLVHVYRPTVGSTHTCTYCNTLYLATAEL